MGVVWPKTSADVAAVVRYAVEKGLSVHFRGAGTSAVGGSIGSGIVLDFTRHMRRALEVGDDFVRVQPGAIRERVNKKLRDSQGRFFAPSSGHVPTGSIGGILAVDNIGPRWLRYGAPCESARELDVVVSSGELWKLRPFVASREIFAVCERDGSTFRRRFLNAALAEANADAYADDARFDAKFDAETTASVGTPDAVHFGLDFADGYGVRSFRSDFAREEFFRRAFGESARAVRELVAKEPWTSALRAIRDVEPFLDREQPKSAPVRCGFPLRDLFRDGFNPMRLFIGTEGALGAIVEAKLSTFPVSKANSSVVLFFESLERAALAVPTVLEYDPTLCDLLDGRVLALARDWDARFEPLFPATSQAALVVEIDADSEEDLRARTNGLFREARARFDSLGGWTALSFEERALFRDLLRKSSCARARMAPSFRPFPFWDDVRVPVEAIPDFLNALRELLQRERIVYSIWGNVGVGQLAIQPILPYSDEEARRAFALSDQVEDLVLSRGGEIGVARGNGRVRAASLTKRYPNLFPAFVKIKDAFDPQNALNPDCVVSPDMRRLAEIEPSRRFPAHKSNASDDEFGDYLAPETDAALRESALRGRSIVERTQFDLERYDALKKIDRFNLPKRSQLEFQISWDPAQIYAPVYQCNSCGHCRIRTDETRMCPAFRNFPDERSSCRAKANLLRGVLDGDLELAETTRDSALELANRCVRCHCCETECPAQVDVPKLTFRLKSAYRAANGARFTELLASRATLSLKLATYFPTLFAKSAQSPALRWILEKTLGIASERKLPLLEKEPYLRRAKRERKRSEKSPFESLEFPDVQTESKTRRKVALFIDSCANFFDAALVDATIRIFERFGVSARVATRLEESGAVAFALGDLDRAEELANRNVSDLRELTRDGTEVVALEPHAALCVRREYPYFIDDEESLAALAQTTDACSYLARLVKDGAADLAELRPLDPERRLVVAYCAPCRSIALSGAASNAPTRAQELLAKIPRLDLRRVELGCCGLSGFLGFTKTRSRESLRIGGRLLLATRNPEFDYRSSECCYCNLQLAQGGGAPVVHALKLLAASLGILSLDDAVLKTLAPDPKRPR